MNLKELGEFGLIGRIREEFPAPDGVLGIGDDCAVIPQSTGNDTLVSTDMLVEGSHFLLEDITPYQLGWKCAAVNFSDIAAMGGRPVGSFLSVALPKNLPDGWMDEFLRGYKEISQKYGFPLLGGDTTSSPDRLCINVTVLGSNPSGRSKMRSGAKAGDLICVTGLLGDAAAGLQVILSKAKRDDDAKYLVEKHYMPSPKMEEGASLAGIDGVHAMADISDGVASDLRHILDESGVGAEVDVAKLPVSEQMTRWCKNNWTDPVKMALSGGEDYELLFTVDPSKAYAIKFPYHVIGRIVAGNDIKWVGTDKEFSGFSHF